MREEGVPSSTTCVATRPLASSDQNKAATSPAWTAVRATSGVEPCSRNEPGRGRGSVHEDEGRNGRRTGCDQLERESEEI